MAEIPTREQYHARLEALRKERHGWITSHWRDLNLFIMPRSGAYLEKRQSNRAENRVNSVIIDPTATLAVRTGKAGLSAGLTSPTRPWFKFGLPDEDLARFPPVKQWLHEMERGMYAVFRRSNVYNVFPQIYGELLVYGTAPMFVAAHPKTTLRCRLLTIGSYMLAAGPDQSIDTLYREYGMTARNLVRQFGTKGKYRVTAKAEQQAKQSGGEQWVDVVQAIEPNLGRDITKEDNTNFPVLSVTYESGQTDQDFLEVSGYRTHPVMSPRWETVGDDTYGLGPGSDAIGDVRGLQHSQTRKSEAIDKLVRPPMMGHHALKTERVSFLPGDMTYVADISAGVKPIYEVDPKLDHLKDDIIENEMRIKTAFYEDLFLMLSHDRKNQPITAREVAELHEEKLLMLGPVLERLIEEMLDPFFTRAIDLATRDDRLPPAPRALVEEGYGEGTTDLKVEYISVLAQAQKAVGTASIERTWAFAGGIAEMVPTVVDKLSADKSIDEFADMIGTPPGIVNSDEEVAEVRADREKRAEEERRAAAAVQAIESAKTASETRPDDASLLGQSAAADMLGGMA